MDVLGLIAIPNWIVYLLGFLVGTYLYFTWNFGYFKARGIPGPKPIMFMGNMHELGKGFHKESVKWVKKYGKIMGYFEMRKPIYLITDVNIIKQIMVKEFSTFTNRRKAALMRDIKMVSILRDHDWKRIRNLLTPTFTSGKLKQMNGTINLIADELVEKFNAAAEQGTVIEAKQTCVSYVIDVIAAVAFGLKTNCQKSETDEFNVNAKKISDAFVKNPLFMVLIFLPPLVPVLEYFGVSLFPNSSMKFFKSVCDSALALRKNDPKNAKVDFLKLMIDANSESLDSEARKDLQDMGMELERPQKGLSDEEMFHQSMVFFIAGNDTTASIMAFLLYQLAIEPEIQQKAYEEVADILKSEPIPTYDSVQKMTYLEMCVNETLRQYVPIAMVDREVGKDITIDGLHLEKGSIVNIGINALHFDEEVWPEPEKFVPERFTPEAVAARNPFYFLPFGFGPRNCLGMRFAQMEMKMAVAKLIHKFRFVPCEETQDRNSDCPLFRNTYRPKHLWSETSIVRNIYSPKTHT